MSTTLVHATVVWEVSSINTTSPVQTATKIDNQSASSTPLGASITTSATGEFVVATTVVANSVTGIHAGNAFTNDRFTNGNGFAHLTSNTASAGTYQAQWDQSSSGAYCSSSAAFYAAP
ncbi:MAG: hypothetical protein DMD48_14285 [Gemmatimonadetes bacterium]|nr:MAG: hypothetical protein DMD96_04410 [Candidatus Rokubacteria bacterium]PYP35452.1 MAG: hypothetical protein DMD48_14285 [Gemmatimonadota bacterium]